MKLIENAATTMIDLKPYSTCPHDLFLAARKKSDSLHENPSEDVPLSLAEEGLREWSDTAHEYLDHKDFHPDVVNNIALIMATWSRNQGGERLCEVEAQEESITLKFDFPHIAGRQNFCIELSKAEVEEILHDPLPIKKAIRISDTRKQISMFSVVAEKTESILSENAKPGFGSKLQQVVI